MLSIWCMNVLVLFSVWSALCGCWIGKGSTWVMTWKTAIWLNDSKCFCLLLSFSQFFFSFHVYLLNFFLLLPLKAVISWFAIHSGQFCCCFCHECLLALHTSQLVVADASSICFSHEGLWSAPSLDGVLLDSFQVSLKYCYFVSPVRWDCTAKRVKSQLECTFPKTTAWIILVILPPFRCPWLLFVIIFVPTSGHIANLPVQNATFSQYFIILQPFSTPSNPAHCGRGPIVLFR